MKIEQVGSLLEDIRYGFTGSAKTEKNGVGFIRVTDIDEYGVVNYFDIPGVEINKKEAERYFLEEGDCIIARSGSVGKAHVYQGEKNKNVFASYLIRLRFDKTKINPSYFNAFTKAPFYWKQIENNKQGGVQQNINTDGLSRLRIPLPDLKTQQEIAHVLEQADKARRQRKAANALTDQFLQSSFLSLFGDPVKNEKGWEVKSISEITENYDNKRVPLKSSDRDKRDGVYPYYGATGVIDYIDDYKLEGDFLLVAEDGKNLVGRYKKIAFPATGKFWVNNHAHVIKAKKNCDNTYIEFVLNSIDISAYVTGIDQFKLNRGNLDRINIPVPPISIQEQFADIVAQAEKLRQKQKESEQELEQLFQSLLQKFFG